MSKYYKKLVGKKVYLSPWTAEDAEIFMTWVNDFKVTDGVMISANYYTLEKEKEHIENSTKKPDEMNFTIIDSQTDQPIGNCGISNIDKVNRRAELGILIGEETSRGKGVGQETLGLLLDYCFNYLNLHSVCLSVLEDNIGAVKCYEKVGFKKQGREREAAYVNGEYRDALIMDILKSEFGEREYITNKFIK
jgi:RimJ/RimL family protein N-acetyltransferase